MEEQQWKHEECVLKDHPQEPLLMNTYSKRLIWIPYGDCSVTEPCSGSMSYEKPSGTVVIKYKNQKGCYKLKDTKWCENCVSMENSIFLKLLLIYCWKTNYIS